MLQKNRKLSDLASALSLSRCFVVRYMRWATSSMAHSLKNRPRFISVRISNLKWRESTEFNLTGDRKGLEGPCIRQKWTQTIVRRINFLHNKGSLDRIKNKIKIKFSARLNTFTASFVYSHHTHPSHYCRGAQSVWAFHFYWTWNAERGINKLVEVSHCIIFQQRYFLLMACNSCKTVTYYEDASDDRRLWRVQSNMNV